MKKSILIFLFFIIVNTAFASNGSVYNSKPYSNPILNVLSKRFYELSRSISMNIEEERQRIEEEIIDDFNSADELRKNMIKRTYRREINRLNYIIDGYRECLHDKETAERVNGYLNEFMRFGIRLGIK